MGFLGLSRPQSLGTNLVPRSHRVTVTTTVKDLDTRLRPAIFIAWGGRGFSQGITNKGSEDDNQSHLYPVYSKYIEINWMSICCKETRRMVFASKLRTATEKLWIWYEWLYVGENKLRTWSQCLSFLTGLTWNRRVSEQCSRANKMLGFVKRNARHMQSIIVRRLIDLIIIRPHLGYATQGWAPQSIYFISNIERYKDGLQNISWNYHSRAIRVMNNG